MLSARASQRAASVRLVLTDCDGVLTDGTVYYGPDGEALKRFSFRDGMGVARLRARGVEVGIVTGERSRIVAARAQKLGIGLYFEGVVRKDEAVREAARAVGVTLDAVAFIGDDVNDLPAFDLLGARGLLVAPADAMPELLLRAHHVCRARGGEGAFRELAELVLLHNVEAGVHAEGNGHP